jgi:hypothetical protein
MWPISIAAATALYDKERRKSPRQIVGEEAELFIPIEDMKIPCVVVNMSAGGAKIACDTIPPTGTTVVLLFKGMSIRAVTAWHCEEELGLRFTTPGDK